MHQHTYIAELQAMLKFYRNEIENKCRGNCAVIGTFPHVQTDINW